MHHADADGEILLLFAGALQAGQGIMAAMLLALPQGLGLLLGASRSFRGAAGAQHVLQACMRGSLWLLSWWEDHSSQLSPPEWQLEQVPSVISWRSGQGFLALLYGCVKQQRLGQCWAEWAVT